MHTPFFRRRVMAVAVAVALAVVGRTAAPHAQATDRERTIFVSAVNDKGDPVQTLAPADVVVREDGARREVLRVSPATEPIDIALLVDTSAAAAGAISQMRDALRMFVTTMAKGNQIAIVTLHDRPTILVDYTSDQKRLTDAAGRIFSMSNAGMTLLDALVEVSRGLQRRDTPRAAIVAVINDGVEFTNRYHRDVIAAVKAANAPLYAVTVGTFATSADQVETERALVLDMGSVETGGQRVPLLSPMGLETALDRLARQLSSQFKVVYARPQSLIPPEKLEITSARRGLTVRGTPMRGQTPD